jgi:sulfatase maturation enzyme AslB (radical SAM superfamily)
MGESFMDLRSTSTFLRSFPIKNFLYDQDSFYTLKWLNLEFCSACNLRCKWCTLDHQKKVTMMSPLILEKVLDELVGNRNFKLERIDLHNAGEVLLHNNLKEMLRIVSSKRRSIPHRPLISLLTNATLLNEVKGELIVESDALDEVRFSVDGGTKELFESIRVGATWEKVKENILKFVEINNRGGKKIKTGIICIVPPEKELDVKWMTEDFRFLFSTMDHISLRYPHNFDGSKDLGLPRRIESAAEQKMCYLLLGNLVILPDGDAVVCCADLNSRGVIGNMTQNTLEELYFSLRRLSMLKMFVKNKKNKITLCENCEGFY